MVENTLVEENARREKWKLYWDNIHQEQRKMFEEIARGYRNLGNAALGRLPDRNIPIDIGNKEYLLRDVELDMGSDQFHLVIQEVYRRYAKGGKLKIILRILLGNNELKGDDQTGKLLFELDPNKLADDSNDIACILATDHSKRNFLDINQFADNIRQWPVYYH